jgi:hypothetical protein
VHGSLELGIAGNTFCFSGSSALSRLTGHPSRLSDFMTDILQFCTLQTSNKSHTKEFLPVDMQNLLCLAEVQWTSLSHYVLTPLTH